MIIGVPKEIMHGERRVAATPETVAKFVKDGAHVLVENGAGVGAFFAALFGPIAGFLIAFIGHALSDAVQYGSPWWSWVIASGVFGLLMGLVSNKLKLADGEFGGKGIAIFNISQVVAHLICWVVVAPVLDIVMYAEPWNKVFLQGFVAAIANIVTTAIVGTILCAAYSAAKPKKDSLEKK